jgi:hypothetical protein
MLRENVLIVILDEDEVDDEVEEVNVEMEIRMVLNIVIGERKLHIRLDQMVNYLKILIFMMKNMHDGFVHLHVH